MINLMFKKVVTPLLVSFALSKTNKISEAARLNLFTRYELDYIYF